MTDFDAVGHGHPTFEETYPRYEFAPLVLLGLVAGAWLVRLLRHRSALAPLDATGRGPTASAG